MASFYIPLTGLESDSTALNSIANNLANLATTGYKAQEVNFSDLFYQQLGTEGSGDLIQRGSGVQIADIQSEFNEGSIVSTGNATDVAVNGNGFFVLGNGTGADVYTRDGNFLESATGALTTQAGEPVMGYPAANGVVNTNAPLTAIQIPVGQVEPAQATTTFGVTANLDATAAVGTTVPGQITMYDSLGVSHIATVNYTKTGTNAWSYSIALPTGDATTSTNTTGTLTFDSSGNLTSPAAAVTGISFSGLSDGAANLSFTWNVNGASGTPTITQTSAASAVSATTQNGFPSGQYQSFSIAPDGTVEAAFSNGQTLAVGRLALANVVNSQGLQLLGGNTFAATSASGPATIGVSGTGGLGTFEGASLEESNVNISQEFSNLIIAQRAFEANSKAVTTFDTVAQETINMVHP
jgi:flagellar hook protein FlgE